MAGDGEFLGVDLLCDGQIKVIPLGIAFLFMGRNGIMDLCFDAVVCEVSLEFVATLAKHREDVIDAVAVRLNYAHEGIAYFSLVAGSNVLATLVGCVEMGQFGEKDGSLDFVDARVATQIAEDVMTRRAVIAKGSNDISQFSIIGGDGTGIAQCAKVLARIEAMGGSRAKRTGPCVSRFSRDESMRQKRIAQTSVGLGVVLDEFEVVAATNIPYPIRIGAAAIEMDDHDGSRTRGDGLFDKGIVNLERIKRRLDEHGLEAVLRDGEDAGDIGIGGHDDLVALLHHTQLNITTKNQRQSIETIATANAILSTDIICVMGLELTRGLAFEIPAISNTRLMASRISAS